MHHEIEITRNGDQVRLPNPMPEMHVHDTVHYRFRNGLVKIDFAGRSPFDKDVITSKNGPMELMRPGNFNCHCTITPEGEKDIGWPGDSEAGGDHVIHP
jgi:hypothetical protein